MVFTSSRQFIFFALLTVASAIFANNSIELAKSELPAIPTQIAENNLNLAELNSLEQSSIQQAIEIKSKDGLLLDKTFTFKELNWQNLRLQGNKTDLIFYLSQPKQIKYKNASLNLELTQSPLLKEGSSLTFLLNNNHLISSLALKAGNTAPILWNLLLPTAELNNDWLSLGLIARWNTEFCKDYDDPANWVYISPHSKLNLQFEKLNFVPEFGNLPYPFNYNNFLVKASENLFVLAAPLTPSKLEPALMIARKLGADAGNNLPQFKVVLANELTENQNINSNQIYVGISKEMPFIQDKVLPLIKKEAQSHFREINSATGILSLMPSLANPFHALLTITGENENALSKAALAFSQANFSKLFPGDLALIQEKPSIFQIDKQVEPIFSLKSLGFADQTTLNLGQSTLSYSFNLPADKVVDKVNINTVLSHSAFKAENHSSLTLSVNGVRQGAIILNNDNGENAVWPITVPGEMLKPGTNSLDYIFDLHIPKEGCASRYDYQSWGLIQAQTTIEPFFSHELPSLVNLNRFPLLFDKNTLIVLPKIMKATEATAILNFFTQLGALYGYDAAQFKLVASDSVNVEMLKNHHLILIGTAKNNVLVEQSLRKAPLRLEKDRLVLHEEDNNQILDKNALGFIELMRSNWNPSMYNMVISGLNEDYYAQILNQFANPGQFTLFKGNIVILMQDGSLTSFETRQPIPALISKNRQWGLLTKLKNETYRKEFMQRLYANLGLTVIAFFSIIVIVLAIVGFFKRRKKDKY